jgi:putative salt-induced outer membrane protein YdiY
MWGIIPIRDCIRIQDKRVRLFLVSLLLTVMAPASAAADEVLMKNGDLLTGTVVRAGEGMLTLKTEYAKSIRVNMSGISTVSTDEPVEVHLSDGQVLKGKLEEAEEGRSYLAGDEGREETSFSWDMVKAINPDKRKWSGNFSVGASANRGNTEDLSVSLAGRATRRTEYVRFDIRFRFNYAEEEEKVTTRDFYGSMKYDYFIRERLYTFLVLEFNKDEFKDLNLRTAVGPGLGYQIWDEEDRALQVEAGVSYFNEDLDEGEDDDWVTGRFAADGRWKVLDAVELSNYFVAYLNLSDIKDTQIRNEASAVDSFSPSWALELTYILEFDNEPSIEVKKTDHTWVAAIRYAF